MFPSLLHPDNPVVFMDIILPSLSPSTGLRVVPTVSEYLATSVQHQTQHRVCIELFANISPVLAKNVYSMCIGATQRVVNGVGRPAGYQGTHVFHSNPGATVSLGDVLCDNGKGMYSIYNGGNHFYAEAPFQKDVTGGEGAPPCICGVRGLVTMYLDDSNTANSLGSAITIRLTESPSEPKDRFYAKEYVVGRVVGRTPTEAEYAISHLQHISKTVYVERKAHASGGDAALPVVVLSGEL